MYFTEENFCLENENTYTDSEKLINKIIKQYGN